LARIGAAAITNDGMIHPGPSTFRVTDPPESRNNSKPVSNRLVAVSRRQYGSGFFDVSGAALASEPPVIVTVMPDSMGRARRHSHE
jgi:hypothetical protein